MIDTIKNIPDKHLMCMMVCNAAENNPYKQQFYQLKHSILEKHGHADGYDRQTIKRKCHACGGKGWYRPGDACYRCFKGVYDTRVFVLKRYRLNDVVFHVPVDEKPTRFKNEIEGYVQHKPFPGNFTFCFATLLWLYDRNKFFIFLGSYGAKLKTRAKHKWDRVMIGCKTPLHGLYNFFGVPLSKAGIKEEDDLPF